MELLTPNTDRLPSGRGLDRQAFRRAMILSVVSAATVVTVGIASILILQQFSTAAQWRMLTMRQMQHLLTLKSLVIDAETAQRGYVLTGDEQFLEPYREASRRTPLILAQLRADLQSDPAELDRLQSLEKAVTAKMASLQANLAIRQTQGLEAAREAILSGPSRPLMDSVRKQADAFYETLRDDLRERDQAVQQTSGRTTLSVSLGYVLATGLLGAALLAALREMRRRDRYHRAIDEAAGQLESRVRELDARNREMLLLGELGDQLQACLNVEEANSLMARYGGVLFPETAGGVYVYSESRDCVQATSSWNGGPGGGEYFDPEECWALRRGQLYRVDPQHPGVPCKHFGQAPESATLCVPMLAQGQVLGLVVLQARQTDTRQLDLIQTLAAAVAEHVGMAVANLRLRESLRQQSIRDPLTGLFNRRYMEESLERELRRASRGGRQVGVIMLDLDRFKALNDTHGHAAGDAVLRGVATLLQTRTRAEDIVCRYGGEEIAIILPEATLEQTATRAEDLRSAIAELSVRHLKTKLQVTASLGVAAFPVNGETGEVLIRAADRALYAAKAAGRNRVLIAPPPEPLEHARA